MTPLAYLLIAVIPLSAVVTIVVARLPTPGPSLHGVTSAELRDRLSQIDRQLAGAPPSDASLAHQLGRDRRRVRGELLRRGHGREPGAQI